MPTLLVSGALVLAVGTRLELTVRFIVEGHGIRGLKDTMSRNIVQALDEADIGIASTTFEIVGLPPLRIEEADRFRSP